LKTSPKYAEEPALTTKGNSPFDDIYSPEIMILGIGSILFSDDGFGIQVAQRIEKEYEFPDDVLVVDGGVLGINLLGVISKPKHLIVIDTMRNQGRPGDIYRIEGEAIPERIRAKNSLHQVDFLEALTLCQALDNVPKTVIIGVEPEDIQTLSLVLTPTVQAQVQPVIEMVLKELERLGVRYSKKDSSNHVSRDSIENNAD
jgi:hydrogenase maturation protease